MGQTGWTKRGGKEVRQGEGGVKKPESKGELREQTKRGG